MPSTKSALVCSALMMTLVTASPGPVLALDPFVPDDPLYAQQWHLDRQDSGAVIDINASAGWAKGWTGQGVVIGIVEGDGGIDETHPDLVPSLVPSLNFASNYVGEHATACAGLAAARRGNGIDTSGVAPHAGLASLNVNFNGSEFDSTQADAARYRNDAASGSRY